MTAMFTRRLMAGGLGLALLAVDVGAQTPPNVFYACYVLATGTVYRIREPGLPLQCTPPKGNKPGDVEFSWTDGYLALRITDSARGDLYGPLQYATVTHLQGTPLNNVGGATSGQVLTFNGSAWTPATSPAGVADHGALTGLADDDHPQYLLGNAARATTNGFGVTGIFGTGTIPATGAGVRLMWYPGKAAFRAGQVSGSQWDDANVGSNSTALGSNTTASGFAATAMGSNTTASHQSSTAMGFVTEASGDFTTALGSFASTNLQRGSFVYGDASTSSVVVTTTAPNQFVVRAAGGTIFYSNSILTAGVSLAPGGGAWASVSDANRKENFREVDGEGVLAKIARLSIPQWTYRAQDPSIRHLGPTAQDFYAAFGLGESALTITTTDIDGVSLLAVQALERRTRDLQDHLATRDQELAALRAQIAELMRRLERLEGSGR